MKVALSLHTLMFLLSLARVRLLKDDFLDGILPEHRDDQNLDDYLDETYRSVDKQFGFIFEEPSNNST